MNIITVERIDWKKELNKLGWYSSLQNLLQKGEFRHILLSMRFQMS